MGAIACATALTTVAACSSSGAGSSAASGSGGGPGDSSALVAHAKAAIAKNTAQPAFKAPGRSINVGTLRGTTVLVVAHDQVADELVGIAQGIQQAGAAAGVNVKVYNGNASVSTIQQGFTQGIQQHVGAIIIDGIDTKLITSSIAAAKGAGIPVVAVENSTPDPNSPGQGAGEGIYANAEPPNYLFGQLIADKAIADSGGQVNAAILTFNNPIAAAAVEGMHAELSQCSGCKVVATATIEPANWPTQVATQTESIAKSNPSMNYVLTAADTMGIFAVSGVKLAAKSSSVHVLGVDGSGPATLALTKDSSVMQADPGSSPTWLGWAALDQSLRAMLKSPAADPTVPYRWIDKNQLANANPKDLTTVYGDSYVAGYKALWGLNG
ncbi:MAG: sugar ABC transporter substrate-binding protein [Sciscionella sp.]